VAWETFGVENGAADLAALRQRIERLRNAPGGDPQGDYRIGCLMIAEPKDATFESIHDESIEFIYAQINVRSSRGCFHVRAGRPLLHDVA